jgi:hypothetical protein
MSFAFRVVADEWTDAEGQPSNMMEGVNRKITEINLNKGDVSAVNYGANPTTSGGFRDMQMALSELRDGREPTAEQRDTILRLARLIGETPEPEPSNDDDEFTLGPATEVLAAMRAHWERLADTAA